MNIAFTHDRLVFDWAYVIDVQLVVKQFLNCPMRNVMSCSNKDTGLNSKYQRKEINDAINIRTKDKFKYTKYLQIVYLRHAIVSVAQVVGTVVEENLF